MTSTRPPSNGPGTRARSRTAAAHCEQPAPPESSRNAASLAATAVACVACDPQLVRTPTNCDQLIYLDRELHPGHYCTLSTGSPPRGSTTTYHSRRPVVSYRTKQPDSSGPYTNRSTLRSTAAAGTRMSQLFCRWDTNVSAFLFMYSLVFNITSSKIIPETILLIHDRPKRRIS